MQVRWFLVHFKSTSYFFYQATYPIAHNGPAMFRNQYNSRRGIRWEEPYFLIFMALSWYLFSSGYVASGVMSQKKHIFSRKIFYSMSWDTVDIIFYGNALFRLRDKCFNHEIIMEKKKRDGHLYFSAFNEFPCNHICVHHA